MYENMCVKMFLSYILLLKGDGGDNDVGGTTASFASVAPVDDDNDESYGPILLEDLCEGNFICLTIR